MAALQTFGSAPEDLSNALYYGHGMGIGTSGIQAALDAAVGGDLDPLVELFDPDLDWRGIERGRLWWRRAPA
jgi:hypothetical protein